MTNALDLLQQREEEERRRREAANAQASIDNLAAPGPSPEQARTNAANAAQLGVAPSQTVPGDDRRSRAAVARPLLESNPLLAQYMANPDAAALARDDIENLDAWTRIRQQLHEWRVRQEEEHDRPRRERLARNREQERQFWEDVQTEEGRNRIGENVGASAEEIRRNLSDPNWWQERGQDVRTWAGDVGEDVSTQPQVSYEIYRRSQVSWRALNGDPSAQAEMSTWEEMDTPEPRTPIGWALQSSVMTVAGLWGGVERGAEFGAYGALGGAALAAIPGSMGPQALEPGEELVGAAAGATRMFPAGFMYGAAEATGQMEAGLAFEEFSRMRDENGELLDPDVARMAALAVGGANGLIEVASVRAILRAFPGGAQLLAGMTRSRMRQLLLQPTFREALMRAAGSVASVAVTEGATEMAQEAVTITAGQLAQMQDGDVFPELQPGEAVDRVLQAGWGGFQAGLVFGAVGGSSGLLYDIPRAQRGQQEQQVFQALSNAAERSRLRQSLPERFHDFIDAVTRDGDVDTVYVNAQQFARFWQENQVDPSEAADALEGVGRERLSQALAAGDDLAIPMPTFYARLAGTPAAAAFTEHMRFDPEAETIAERRYREANDGTIRRTVKQILEASDVAGDMQEAVDVISAEVEAQLERTGTAVTEVSRAHAQAFARGIVAQAENAGVNPLDLWQRINFNIVGPLEEEARAFVEGGGAVDDVQLLEQAERSGYMGRNAGEAMAWLEARAKGLDMSRTGLDQRAKRQGYDMVAFTGRRRPLEQVTPRSARHRAADAATGMWAARAYDEGQEASIANSYAGEGEGSQVVPIRIRTRNFLRVPVHGELSAENRLARIEEAKRRGKHGVIFENIADYARFFDRGDRRTMGDVVVAFREEDVRSVFDPFAPGVTRYNQLGGEKAKTFPTDMVPVAEAMERDGRDRQSIWRATGLARGDEGKWRYEISTEGANLRYSFAKAKTLEEALDFPALYEAYPQLRKVPVDLAIGPALEGYWQRFHTLDPATGVWSPMIYMRGESDGDVRSGLLHELQHAIQDHEGFARGGSPEAMAQAFPALFRSEVRRVLRILFEAYGPNGKEYNWTVQQFGLQLPGQETPAFREYLTQKTYKRVTHDLYWRLAGESEARDVQDRDAFLTDAERQNLAPGAEEQPFRYRDMVGKADRIVLLATGDLSFFTRETELVGERYGGKPRAARRSTPGLPAVESAEFATLRDTSTAKRDRGERLSLVEKWAIEAGEAAAAAADQRYNQDITPVFYSALEQAVEAVGTKKATPAQWRQTIENAKGVKREELEWSGVFEWLDLMDESGRKVTKTELLEFLRANGLQVSEVIKQGDSDLASEEAAIIRMLERRDALARDMEKESREIHDRYDAQAKEASMFEALGQCAAANGFGAGMAAVTNMMGGQALGAAAAIPATVAIGAALAPDEQAAQDVLQGRREQYPTQRLRPPADGLYDPTFDALAMSEAYPFAQPGDAPLADPPSSYPEESEGFIKPGQVGPESSGIADADPAAGLQESFAPLVDSMAQQQQAAAALEAAGQQAEADRAQVRAAREAARLARRRPREGDRLFGDGGMRAEGDDE